MAGMIGQLLMPNYYKDFQQGMQDGQAQLQRRTLAQYVQPALGGDQGALAKIYGVDPQAGMQVQQQAGTFKKESQQQLADFTRVVSTLADKGDMQGAADYYRANVGSVQQATGMQLGPELQDRMLPHIKQVAETLNPQPAQQGFTLGAGQTRFGADGKPIASAPAAAPKDSGEVATLKALQADPALMATYQKMHPRPAVSVTGGFGHAPSGYRFAANGDLEAIPGGPADSSGSGQGLSGDAIDNAAWTFIGTGKLPAVGRGKEGVAQRTAVMNRSAAIAKTAGIAPAELQTVPGRNKALQASLTNLQKMSDVMEKSEAAFQNNTKVAMDLSSKLTRSGSPAINQWLLGAKGQMGDPDVKALDAAITTMAVDYARIMSGMTGAAGTPISTAEEAKALIRKELSHKQLSAVVDVLNRDIAGQQAAVHAQRGKILGAMQQMHDEASPALGGDQSGMPTQTAMPSADSDPLGLLK